MKHIKLISLFATPITIVPCFFFTSCFSNNPKITEITNYELDLNEDSYIYMSNVKDPKVAADITDTYHFEWNWTPEQKVLRIKYISAFASDTTVNFSVAGTELSFVLVFYSPQNFSTYEEHINYWTFGLAINMPGLVYKRGTGWLINRIGSTGYEYYLGTNWHVTLGTTISSARWAFGDSLGTSYTSFQNVSLFNESTEQNYYSYSNSYMDAIDFHILRVDFGASINGAIKARLDTVNTWFNGKTMNDIYAQDYQPTTSSNKKFIGGYPVRDNSATWEFHSLNSSSASGKSSSYSHYIDSEANSKYDTSPQYSFASKPMSENWMSGGASGSMVLDENYKICGIYWGGWNTGNTFTPYASIFDSNYKNFISACF